MRTLVIGDIHGALKALKQCLERCNYDPKEDCLIFLGDYVDGWSESSELIEFLIKLEEEAVNTPIFLMGNHDIWCKDWLNLGEKPILWTTQGGQATIDSYIRTGHLTDDRHRQFFRRCHDWYHDTDSNRLYIHGGWDYRSAPFPEGAKYPVNAGKGSKDCHWDRSLLQGAKSASNGGRNNENLFNATHQFREVFIGHTAQNDGPHQYCNLWNMDTGCGWFGKLTIMNVETKEFWQSDDVQGLYPEEKGRQ